MEPVREGPKKLNVSAQNAPEHPGITKSDGSGALSLEGRRCGPAIDSLHLGQI
jgi:hypothetical protein